MLQLTSRDILLGKHAENKHEAIINIAGDLVKNGLAAEGYEQGMLAREGQNSTYLGNGIAIPHGTVDTRDLVNRTGVQIHHFKEGVDWGDGNRAHLVIGIAAKSDEHLGILKQLTHVLSADGVEEALTAANSEDEILAILNGQTQAQTALLFDSSLVETQFPASDLFTLIAAGAANLKKAGAVSESFTASIILKTPTALGHGMYLVASNQAVNNDALSFVSAQSEFEHQGQPARAVLLVASQGQSHLSIMKNLAQLISKGKLAELTQAPAENVIKLLSEVKQDGTTEIFTIKNPHGLHARPGASLVNVVKQFEAKIWVSNISTESKQVNAKSLMKVIALGVKQGHQLEFTVEGEDGAAALAAIGEAIESGLGEG